MINGNYSIYSNAVRTMLVSLVVEHMPCFGHTCVFWLKPALVANMAPKKKADHELGHVVPKDGPPPYRVELKIKVSGATKTEFGPKRWERSKAEADLEMMRGHPRSEMPAFLAALKATARAVKQEQVDEAGVEEPAGLAEAADVLPSASAEAIAGSSGLDPETQILTPKPSLSTHTHTHPDPDPDP